MYIKRQNRLEDIFTLKENIKSKFEELKNIAKSQNQSFSYQWSFEEDTININKLISTIIQMKAPSIIIVKWKFIDLLIFWIIKANKNYFNLDKERLPNNAFLKKILHKLEKQIGNNKIKEKIIFIKNLIKNNNSNTNFPMSIINKDLYDLILILNYYKSKCNKIVIIGKKFTEYNYNITNLFYEDNKENILIFIIKKNY